MLRIDTQEELEWLNENLLNKEADLDKNYYFQDNVTEGATPGGGSGYIIQYLDYHHPLRLQDAHNPDTYTDVWERSIITLDDMQRLSWNSSTNHFGSVTFQEVAGDQILHDPDSEEEEYNENDTTLSGNQKIGDPITLHFLEVEPGQHPEGVWAKQGGSRLGVRSVDVKATAGVDAADHPMAEADHVLPADQVVTASGVVPATGVEAAASAVPADGGQPATGSDLPHIWHGTSPLLEELGQLPPL